jgi:hypothetical protein
MAALVQLPMPMRPELWWKEARRAARWWWSYEELVDDAKADLDHLREQGEDPYEAVKRIGKELDLHEFGPAWGGW